MISDVHAWNPATQMTVCGREGDEIRVSLDAREVNCNTCIVYMRRPDSNTSSQPVSPGGPHPPPEVRLLGRKVRVTLDRDVVARGQLLRVSAMGEVVLLADDGDVHWCWPGLAIEEDPA